MKVVFLTALLFGLTIGTRKLNAIPIGPKMRQKIEAGAKFGPVSPAQKSAHSDQGSLDSESNGRIVGGQEAAPHQFPWVAHLQCFVGSTRYVCTSSILSETTILTAAHCVEGCDSFIIQVGVHNWENPEPEAIPITATQAKMHENYNPSLLLNDIAIVTLSESIPLDDNTMSPVVLPSYSDASNTYTGSIAVATGWGVTQNHGGQVSDVLMYADDIPVISNEECKDYYSLVPDTILCIGVEQGSGICSGDSGGPLNLYDSSLGSYIQIGIVSFSSSSGCIDIPDGYTRVTSFLDWIELNGGVTIRP